MNPNSSFRYILLEHLSKFDTFLFFFLAEELKNIIGLFEVGRPIEIS